MSGAGWRHGTRWGMLAVALLLGGGLIWSSPGHSGAAWHLPLSCAAAGVLMLAAGVLFHLSARQDAATTEWLRRRHLAMLGEMSAVLAHEIRNPLASLKGHAQLLAEQVGDDSPARRSADRVVQEAVRLEHLTRQLLSFARTAEIERRPVDPVAVLRDSIAAVQGPSTATPRRIVLHDRGAPSVFALDPLRVRQVLTNILQNALQASAQEEAPEATVTLSGDRLVYLVRDFGPGIPPDQEEQIFAPFHTNRATGTGLGLAVARRIIELHGGTITAANHPSGGAEFRVEIPHGEHPGRR